MIKIKKAKGMEEEYLQCTSCLQCNNDLGMFRLIIGKNMNQTATIKLCEDCMRDFLDDLRSLEINGQI